MLRRPPSTVLCVRRSCRHLATGKVSSAYESLTKNWGESVTLRPDGMRFAVPSDLAELQEVVRSASAVRVVGSAHSFNDISVSDLHGPNPTLVATQYLGAVHDVQIHEGATADGSPRMTVRVDGGATYGELMRRLAPRGLALRNVPSLPHVTVAGAIMTGTHGSGLRLPSLAGDVAALQLVRADGETVRAVREEWRGAGLYEGEASAGEVPFEAAAVSLGCLGVVASLCVEVVAAYHVHQRVLQSVALAPLLARRGALLGRLIEETHSLSLFIDFARAEVDVGWLRQAVAVEAAPEPGPHLDMDGAEADAAYFADPHRSGFHPQPPEGSAAASLLRDDPRASLRSEPVAFLESGMDVLSTRAGRWFEVLPFFVAPHTRPPRDAVMPNTALHSEFFLPLGPAGAPFLGANGLPDVSNAAAALEALTPVAARWRGWGELGEAWRGEPETDSRGAPNPRRDPRHSGTAVMSEIRVIRSDRLLLSPTHAEPSAGGGGGAEPGAFLAIHMTWGGHDGHAEAARRAAREMEAALRPYGARPHWGKLFLARHEHGAAETDLASIGELYGERLRRFKALCVEHDPGGKLRQAEWVRRVLGAFPSGGKDG